MKCRICVHGRKWDMQVQVTEWKRHAWRVVAYGGGGSGSGTSCIRSSTHRLTLPFTRFNRFKPAAELLHAPNNQILPSFVLLPTQAVSNRIMNQVSTATQL